MSDILKNREVSMKKKGYIKGFTLIEILAIITMIAIVLLVTTPVVNNAIYNTALKTYKANEKSLAVASENYYLENGDLLPLNIGDKETVFLDDLVNGGYIKKIKDLKDKTSYCDGYVIVEKINAKDYSYLPYLICPNYETIIN